MLSITHFTLLKLNFHDRPYTLRLILPKLPVHASTIKWQKKLIGRHTRDEWMTRNVWSSLHRWFLRIVSLISSYLWRICDESQLKSIKCSFIRSRKCRVKCDHARAKKPKTRSLLGKAEIKNRWQRKRKTCYRTKTAEKSHDTQKDIWFLKLFCLFFTPPLTAFDWARFLYQTISCF